MGRKPRMAFLIYAPLKERRKNNSFIGNGNIGALVVKDMLQKSGYDVGWCVDDTAHKYDIVLVSLTSTHDVFALYRAVAPLSTWQRNKRTFSVWAGGFGMQNPTAVREYIDWAFFGRVDDWLCDIAAQLIAGGYAEHKSLMDMRTMNNVEIAQATKLYGGFPGRQIPTGNHTLRSLPAVHSSASSVIIPLPANTRTIERRRGVTCKHR